MRFLFTKDDVENQAFAAWDDGFRAGASDGRGDTQTDEGAWAMLAGVWS